VVLFQYFIGGALRILKKTSLGILGVWDLKESDVDWIQLAHDNVQ
jgi:hypothetical protein